MVWFLVMAGEPRFNRELCISLAKATLALLTPVIPKSPEQSQGQLDEVWQQEAGVETRGQNAWVV